MEKMLDLMRRAHVKAVSLKQDLRDLRKNDDGAALIEYTVLIGLITVAVIGTVIAVGGWVTGRWTALSDALGLGGG